jgi:hypothetical protein
LASQNQFWPIFSQNQFWPIFSQNRFWPISTFGRNIYILKRAKKFSVTLVDSNDIANHNEVVEEINSSSWQKHQQQQFCPQPFLAKSPPKPYPTRESPTDGCQMMVQPLNYRPIDETGINATQNLTIPLCFFDKFVI